MDSVDNKNSTATFAHSCSCKSCSDRIKKAIQKIRGVESVDIIGRSTVVARGTFDADVLKQTIFKKTRKNLMVLSRRQVPDAPESLDVAAESWTASAAKRTIKADEIKQKSTVDDSLMASTQQPDARKRHRHVEHGKEEASSTVVRTGTKCEGHDDAASAGGSKGQVTAEGDRDMRRQVAVFQIGRGEYRSDVVARVTYHILRSQGVQGVHYDRNGLTMSVSGTFDIGAIMNYLHERAGSYFHLITFELEKETTNKKEAAQATNLGWFWPAFGRTIKRTKQFLQRLAAAMVGLVDLEDFSLE